MKFRSTGDRKPNTVAAIPAIPEQRTIPFMDLPVEIHQHIIADFLKDLNTTFEQFKALRLVCRRFDAIVKRRVYSSHIKVFRKSDDEHLLSNVDQLLTLLSSKPNEQLHATTTLLIANCDWLNGKSFFTPFHQVGLTEDTKFRLDSHFLQRESETLKAIIAASKADSIRLDGTTVAEFRALWGYFYEGMYDDYKPSTTEWMDLLAIANTYGFTKVYRRAVYEIDDLDGAIDPIERILLAKRLKVNRWLAPAYAALCSRTDPITASEAEKLGMYTFVALVAARESFYRDNSPLNTSTEDPVSLVTSNLRCCGYSPAQLTDNVGEAVETSLDDKDEPPKEDAKAGGAKRKKGKNLK
ncbi:hypothetical protein F5887DRAFT_917358 [Amanita rubescens]|nr:hypothetical protein F5887DRAFT_917358 [Amanita rubescens]